MADKRVKNGQVPDRYRTALSGQPDNPDRSIGDLSGCPAQDCGCPDGVLVDVQKMGKREQWGLIQSRDSTLAGFLASLRGRFGVVSLESLSVKGIEKGKA